MERLDNASRHPSIDSLWHADYIAYRVSYAIRRDNLEEAGRWGEQLPDMAGLMLKDRPVGARLLLAQGKREAASALLRELHDSAVKLGATLVMMKIRIYQALSADNVESALEFLAEALTLAAPEGLIRFFADEGRLLRPLLGIALSRQITPAFTRKLLGIIDGEERLKRAGNRTAATVPPAGLLSERELEVLRLLADDVPNQRIADKLSVSLSTVKTHVSHIISKLEVKDRRQAVQRATELKLL
jgi:LuxR family maltose regulon positive regulatory protein